MDRPSGSTRRPGVIRADPAQTEILRNALIETSNPSADQLAGLSEKTNLPPKWIHNWFSRQRVKANKTSETHSKGARDRLHVKQETLEGLDFLGATSSPAMGSVSDTTTLLASSSITTLDALHQPAPNPTQGNARKGKTKRSNVGAVSAQKSASPPRVLRSRKRKGNEVPNPNVQGPSGRRVKAEHMENVGAAMLRYTPVDDATAALEPGTNLVPTAWPAAPLKTAAPPTYKLPSVAPPQRSPMTTVQPRPDVHTTPRSGLAKSHMQLQDVLSKASTGKDTIAVMAAATTTRAKGARRAPAESTLRRNSHGHGPMFRSQLQSNLVPAYYDYENNAPTPPSSSAYAQYGGEVYTLAGEEATARNVENLSGRLPALYMPHAGGTGTYSSATDGTVYYQFGIHPLAPAFDWENHAPSASSALAEPVVLQNEGQQNHHAFDNEPAYQCERDANPRSYHEQIVTTSNSPADVLDSLKAPLKHLTDILHAFRDENGSYMRLLAPEEHENMLKCLLDDSLMPFESAMALALLSRLGFQWN